MLNQFSRTELLFGQEAMSRLPGKKVAIFGVGGVGGYVIEGLVRSGIDHFELIDDDRVCLTNLNRQVLATISSVGHYKIDVAEERIHDINRKAIVEKKQTFYLKDQADDFNWDSYDYVVDALDTVSAKLSIIEECDKRGIPVISCMGAGNKLDPSKLEITDIYKTSYDPLARVMRHELKKRHIRKLKVCYSKEPPIKPVDDHENSCLYHCICPPGTARKCTDRRDIPGSVSFVPSVAGLMIAGEIVKDFAWQRL